MTCNVEAMCDGRVWWEVRPSLLSVAARILKFCTSGCLFRLGPEKERSEMNLKAIVFTFGLLYLSSAVAEPVAVARALKYGKEIQNILVDKILREFTGLGYFEEKYQTLDLQVLERNTTQLVHSKVDLLKKILKDREDLVKRVANEARKLRNVNIDHPLTAENVTFYVNGTDASDETSNTIFYRNAKCECSYQRPGDVETSQCTKPDGGYAKSSQFGNYAVSFENSSVHIPTEIYNEGPDVLKDIYHSHGIGEVMRSEICKESNFSSFSRWVYFTSQRGIMRFFPDRAWSDDCDMPDVYDSRTSPWFLNAISSPKDITVLVDRSGSVEGSTLNLLRRSVRDFLDTVTTNDFINIILFNEEASFINGECRGLLQGTPRNKQILQKWMEGFGTKGQAFYEEGFNLTLKTLDLTQRTESHTAKCNPIVMFFTDGDSVYPDNALTTWNGEKDKRIFTFTVGKNFYGKEVTKDIACKNRGYSNTVPSFTATKEAAYNYLAKLSEPLASNTELTVKWTLPYPDQFGLGFVISASVPVKEVEERKDKIAGVVGTDILLEDLEKAVIEPDMGEDYYPFLVDNNGFAVIHPNLRKENHDDIISVDFIELENKKEMVRQNILDGHTETVSEEKDIVLDKKYLLTSSYTFDYAPVDGTVFKFGLGVHSSKLKRLDSVSALQTHFPDLTFSKLVNEQKSTSIALLYSDPCASRDKSTFNPCETDEDTTSDTVNPPDFINGLPLQDFDASTCDASSPIYADLLLHAYLSDDLSAEQWEENSSVQSGNGILALFTALETPSFLRLKYLNFTEQTDETIKKDDSTVKEEIKKILANPKDSSYLRRSTHTHTNSPGWTTYSFVETPNLDKATLEPVTTSTQSTETSHASTTGHVTPESVTTATTSDAKKLKQGYIVASRTVQIFPRNSDVGPVVMGAVLDPETFQRKIFNLAYKCNDSSSCDMGDWDLVCDDPENTECLILDNGGHLLSSNQEKHFDKVNKFFGLIDGEFMTTLINERVFTKSYFYDYQAICEKSEVDRSAGIRAFYIPSVGDILSVGWWLSSCAKMFFYTLLQDFFVGLWSYASLGSSHIVVDNGGALIPSNREQCIYKKPVLSYGQNSHDSHVGTFRCTENCQRAYTVVRIVRTNLVLVTSETAATCGEVCSVVAPLSNEEVQVDVTETCNNETRYRRPPEESCYDARNYLEELDSPCSSAMKCLPLSYLFLVFISYFYFIIHRIMS